ncbi:hypothetical protein Tco_1082592 [Tanacetum coccineum]|uniref:Uncharacterized protein n=1 Tax=Tanacetum coccineum TaxID=301880 RepID=A0ABQ5I2H9_9ASTR
MMVYRHTEISYPARSRQFRGAWIRNTDIRTPDGPTMLEVAYPNHKMAPRRNATTTPMTDAAIKALIAQGVATALAEYEATHDSGNGDDSDDSRTGGRK